MRGRELIRYARELGWRDPLECAPTVPAKADGPTAGAGGTLDELAGVAARCTACRLCEGRTTVVFGEGAPDAPVMFIGEGPGAEEDRTGRPFVGQAGKLLDRMIFALGFAREQVYIANVVKCRPPGNRDPHVDEVAACAPFLDRQIELVRPRVLVALGRPAAHRLTGSSKPMRALRGSWLYYRGIPLLATFHPAYLLRSPSEKRHAWEDLKLIRRRLASAG